MIVKDSLILLVLIPLISGVLTRFFAKDSKLFIPFISVGSILLNLLISLSFLSGINLGNLYLDNVYSLISIGNIEVEFSLFLDKLGIIMILLVNFISFLVHLYSLEYMEHDKDRVKFFSYLNFFTAFMLLLILSSNFIVMLMGWEAVGIMSYLLISFWNDKEKNIKAGLKALYYNRFGDVFLFLGIIFFFYLFGTFDFLTFKALEPVIDTNTNFVFIIGLFLFIGVASKSAQTPLFPWLSDAMAGPTPVSALIHAATMVTAGVFLMLRLFPFFSLSEELVSLIFYVSLFTAFISGISACFQKDIKKLLAYSTISHLSLMILSISLGLYWVAILHLVIHGFFKASLFLISGNIIHQCNFGEFEKLGGLKKNMPYSRIFYIISGLSLAGIYPLSGYFSKHLIHDEFIKIYGLSSLNIVFTLITFFSVIYIVKGYFEIFEGKRKDALENVTEIGVLGLIPIGILSIITLCSGFFLESYFAKFFNGFFNEDIHIKHLSSLEIFQSLTPIFACLLLTVLFYSFRNLNLVLPKTISNVFYKSFYINEIIDFIFVKPFLFLARTLNFFCDFLFGRFINEGISSFSSGFGLLFKSLQTGSISTYLLFISVSIVFIFIFIVGL